MNADFDQTNGENLERWRLVFRRLFDTSPANAVLLNLDGVILEINSAWQRYGQANGLSPSFSFIGKNYLQVCASTQTADQPIARRAYAGLQGVLRMGRPKFTMDYPCHTPTTQQWYRMWVQPQLPQVPAVVVAHYLIKQGGEFMQENYDQGWSNPFPIAETVH